MKKRNGIATILLLTFILPVVLLFSWHQVKLYEIKHSLKWELAEALDPAELVLIKLTKAEADSQLEWEHDHEFEYLGEMYDVVKKETHTDTLFFYCWWDKKETKLNKKLEHLSALVFQHNPDKQKNEQRILQYYKSLFVHSRRNWKALQNCSQKEFIVPYVESTYTANLKTPSPPPKSRLALS